jgi:hypothetical protein
MKFNSDEDEANEIRVRAADKEYFEDAQSGGHVYGYLEFNKLPVYVLLGKKLEKYISFLERYPETKYKYFRNCELRVAETDELLDEEIYLHIFEDKNVILIY